MARELQHYVRAQWTGLQQDRSALAPAHVVTVKKPTVVPPPRPWAFPFLTPARTRAQSNWRRLVGGAGAIPYPGSNPSTLSFCVVSRRGWALRDPLVEFLRH